MRRGRHSAFCLRRHGSCGKKLWPRSRRRRRRRKEPTRNAAGVVDLSHGVVGFEGKKLQVRPPVFLGLRCFLVYAKATWSPTGDTLKAGEIGSLQANLDFFPFSFREPPTWLVPFWFPSEPPQGGTFKRMTPPTFQGEASRGT